MAKLLKTKKVEPLYDVKTGKPVQPGGTFNKPNIQNDINKVDAMTEGPAYDVNRTGLGSSLEGASKMVKDTILKKVRQVPKNTASK